MTVEHDLLTKFDNVIELLQDIKSKLEEIEENTYNINAQLADRDK
jgi:hypothetical protein